MMRNFWSSPAAVPAGPLDTTKVRMSRRASAPSASKPSGMSERRVFSRVEMSSLAITRSPFVLRSVMLAAFSLAITPVSVSPFLVVTFHCQKLGSTSRFGSRRA